MARVGSGKDKIANLRKARGETQAEFAKVLGVTQPMVSAWEAGADDPPLAAYLRLGSLAPAPDNLWFWEQAGIQREPLLSAAETVVKSGGVKMDSILAAAEQKLKERVGDAKAFEDEGKVVLVPPFGESASAGVAEEKLLALPAFLVSHKASTYYMVAQPPSIFDAAKRGFAPGDIIVFDSSEELKTDFDRLAGEEWLFRLPERPPGPGGLFLGRAGYVADGPTRHMVIAPFDAPPSNWQGLTMHHPSPFIKVGPSHEKGFGPYASHRVHDWHDFSDVEVLGKFIARYTAGTVEFWKRGAKA